MPRAIEAMVDVLLLLAGDFEFPRVSALPGSQDHALGTILALVAGGIKDAVLLLEALESFFGVDLQLVFRDDVVPALDQILFTRAVEPQLAFWRAGIRLGVDPLVLRKILNGVSYLAFFQNHDPQAAIVTRQRGIQSRGAGSHYKHVVDAVLAGLDVRTRSKVRRHLKALRHGQLDHRRAGQVADDVQTRNIAFVVGLQCRATRGHVTAGKDVLDGLAKFGQHGYLTLSTSECV